MLPDPEEFADQILTIVGQKYPPTDVRAILGRWPQLSVVETELDGDGLFVDLGEIGGEILVKKSKQETRKRFTLAHELGHYFLGHHIREDANKQQIESWCNHFAAGLLIPKEIVTRYLKSGGLHQLTKRLCDGPAAFQVSEKAFYLRITRILPISVISVIFSSSEFSIVDEYHNEELKDCFGDRAQIWDNDLKEFLFPLPSAGLEQHRLQKFDRTWMARRTYKGSESAKFLLVLLKR
jgi:hypothetical protein